MGNAILGHGHSESVDDSLDGCDELWGQLVSGSYQRSDSGDGFFCESRPWSGCDTGVECVGILCSDLMVATLLTWR